MTSTNTDTGDTTTITTTSSTTELGGSGLHPVADTNIGDGATSTTMHTTVAAAPREALITTAVNFLQNAKVRHTTLMQKQQFLRSKGLTMEEIQLACERAGAFGGGASGATIGAGDAVINMGISSHSHHSQMALQPQQTMFGRIKEVLHSIALLSGVAYAVYVFWKKIIVPFLFGTMKKKPIDKALKDIEEKVDTRINEVNSELTQLKDTLSQQQREQNQQFHREFNNFRSDLETIKGLLLNRKQFASPLTAIPGAASIPAWQLSSATSPHHHRHQHHSQSDDNEKADDAGSGSGSSETEVVTKNSDSSLEIM